jgi:hypothetical protein
LITYAPQRLLVVGASQFPALEAFQQAHPDARIALGPGALPEDVAANALTWPWWSIAWSTCPKKREGLELLGGIRNLNASRIAVLADLTACDWKETDFFALALQNNESFQRDEQILTLFTYDLREYKQVPDWLNARFWANPENFGKYWW